MGFYLRRSLKLGPLRVNLSKSGVGLSAGVKGARLGVDAKGRPYVAGGRGGLYFRQQLGQGQQQGDEPGAFFGPDDAGFPRRLAWILAVSAVVVVLAALWVVTHR
jgi:hypothetical protein